MKTQELGRAVALIRHLLCFDRCRRLAETDALGWTAKQIQDALIEALRALERKA